MDRLNRGDADKGSWMKSITGTRVTDKTRELEPAGPELLPESGDLSVPSGTISRPAKLMLLAWFVVMALGIAYALLQPVWSRVDEAQHFHYVQYLYEEKALPVEGETFISPEVIEMSLEADQWGWRPAGTVSTPQHLDPAAWNTVPEELSDNQREKWVRWNLWQFNYEAMQPPLYYAVNLPLYAALPDDPFIRLYAMRIFAIVMAATIIPITYLVAREAFPDSRLVLYGAPLAAMLIQGYPLNMSQMTNDVLAIPLAGAAILVLLRSLARGVTWKRTLLAGVLIGASMLAKLTTIFLIPVALAAFGLIYAYRRERAGRAVLHAAAAVAIAFSLMVPWIINNLFQYGDTTGVSAARPLMSSFFMSPLISIETLRVNELWPTFWFGEPVWPEMPFPFYGYAMVGIFTGVVAGVAGLIYYFSRGRAEVREVQPYILFLVFTFIIGFAVNLVLPFGSGIGGVPGRYLYPLIPVISFLLVFGIDRLLRRERALFFAELLLVWLVVFETVNFLTWLQHS
jgi:4-amino-4-deoxy-L-arabinose transferase-like glycosyltransferase